MINTSDYNRTGIFIEERRNDIVDVIAPSAPNVHFVPGFSRKSTVFNRPVLITSTNDRKSYFGDIDRQLEKKGSFFHRTIDIALQTAPVYAMNLLQTNDDDTLEYVSLSLAAQYNNDTVRLRKYDDFFNKAGFWQRDTESFLFFAKNNEKKFHITNVGNKTFTVFMFKTTLPGFDMTAEQWYATKNQDLPTWMSPKSLINDYLVRVVVVSGDYSNYAQLSVDPTFYKYFSASGLRKNMVDSFIRDRAVSTLADYTGSVIPYFTDMQNKNMFIESLINNDTDRTGLFAAMDIDTIETDYSTGVVDLIGETLVGLDQSKINFLSYKDTISEVDSYEENTFDNSLLKPIVDGISITLDTATNTLADPDLTIASLSNAKVWFNGEYKNITLSSEFTVLTYIATPVATSGTVYRTDLIYVTSDGILSVAIGTETTTLPTVAPVNYPNDAYPLFTMDTEFDITTGDKTSTYKNVFGTTITTYSGYTPSLVAESTAGVNDYLMFDDTLLTNNPNEVKIIFKTSPTPNKVNYGEYFINQIYNEYINNMTPYAYLLDGTTKHYFSDAIVVEGTTVGPNTKFVHYTFTDAISVITDIVYSDTVMEPISSTTLGFSSTPIANYALIGKDSEIYRDYIDGMINSGDYFLTSNGNIGFTLMTYSNLSNPTVVGNYMVMTNAYATQLGISSGAVNKSFTIPVYSEYPITLQEGFTASSSVGTILGIPAGTIAFRTEDVITVGTYTNYEVLNTLDKVYLKMYSVGENVKIEFCGDNTLTSPYGSIIHNAPVIHVYSGESNYTQSLDLITHNAYTMTDTKFLIDMARYNEVKIGDFVAAYYDETSLEPGEQPKKFARIIKKTAWSGNTQYGVTYAEITVDAKYDVKEVSPNVFQTTRYTTIENYIDTYKGIVLNGFSVQQHSIPNGTENRQKEILSIIGKDTPLYNAITNKQKFNFRYLIDSFGLGLTEFSKQELMDIAGKRKNCIAMLNAPSAKMFKESTNPYFINNDGTLNMEFVQKGGDEERNPAFLYSFGDGSGKDDGRDASAYFFPYVTVNDNGRPLSFPPAAYAANTYMRKNSSVISGKYNFTVAAGVNDGLILGIANTEMDFTEKDYESADAMGLNLISYNSSYGYYIETEYTASVKPKGTLSNLHVRELLIDMENEMYAMLFKYQYQFNIASIRAKIKREADDICQKYYDRGGITYYLNVIDESNNTAELIDNQFGLLETTIVPVSAMAKIVNIFNITSNGALASSTGFSAQ